MKILNEGRANITEKNTNEYIRTDTKLPMYIPVPRFIIPMRLSQTAKLIYGLLLGRATLSQKNKMTDEDGNVYVIYPVRSLASYLERSEVTIKNAEKELAVAGLLEKRKSRIGPSNLLYVLVPDKAEQERILLGGDDIEVKEKRSGTFELSKETGSGTVLSGKENVTCISEAGKEKYTRYGKNSLPDRKRKLSTNYINKTNKRVNNYEFKEGESF